MLIKDSFNEFIAELYIEDENKTRRNKTGIDCRKLF